MQRSRNPDSSRSSSSQSMTNNNRSKMVRPKTAEVTPSRLTDGAITRARSHSASSSKASSTGTTGTSGSSSSASSSSSSSSGSGSDSSSSDTEASMASSQSRTSRTSRSSRKSQTSDNRASASNARANSTNVGASSSASVTNVKSQKHSGGLSHLSNGSPSSSQGHKKSTKQGSSSSVISSGVVSNSLTTTTKFVNRANNRPPLSGSVTNVKAPIARVAPTRPFRRKSFAATSSESESSSAVQLPIVKRVGSKPPSIPITVSRNPNSPIPSSSGTRKPSKSSSSSHKKGSSSSGLTNGKLNAIPGRNQKKLLKSIFSPDNSSADSDDERRMKRGNSASGSVSITGSIIAAKKSSVASRFKKRLSPTPNNLSRATSSSSLSASTSGSGSSSSSSSGSSSDSDKKPSDINSGGGKRDPSPNSHTGSGRKRPVTRRQIRSNTVKSKTIPTTTMFTESVANPSPVQISTWDSDFSDEPKAFVRVPAKSSHKSVPIPKPPEDEEDFMERERRCHFPGCDSSGHLSGKWETHSLLSTCPKYAGFSVEECKENAIEREKREIERAKHATVVIGHHRRPPKLSPEAKNWLVKMKVMKETETKDGLCSQYDMSLWNDSLALAAARIEEEQKINMMSYKSVAFGRFEMGCWCESPYAEPLSHSRRLFICEFCLKPVQSGTVLRRHCAKCVWRHPPGDEIYRKDRLSVWEVDGKTQKTYCQNLCLLAKCFLDHKTLYLDVDPFLFYVMTLADSQGCHLVGYFSKEKNSFLNYNVSCILTLPPYQRQGFGRLLIDFSYLLTRVEGKVGSPEKPLSDLGLISYRSYWKDAVLKRMCACATREMNVKDLSIELGVTSADLISTLQFLGMLKYWKGKHLVLKKTDVLEEYLERVRRRDRETRLTRQIEPSCLRWRPFQPPAETSS